MINGNKRAAVGEKLRAATENADEFIWDLLKNAAPVRQRR